MKSCDTLDNGIAAEEAAPFSLPRTLTPSSDFPAPAAPLRALSEVRPPLPQLSVGSDLLFGAKAIAAELGLEAKQIYHLVEMRYIPFFKIGGTVCARRSSLRSWFELREAEHGRQTG